jgi:peptidoglycan/xylan/chitin deacetylase (PgdA/CDA1 family)
MRSPLVRLRRWRAAKSAILMYHRIADPAGESDPWGLCVSPARFAEQLAVLRECGTPITLSALVRDHERGDVPRGGVVVTFDDGYADNLHTAKPLLERYDVPATVFVTTGHIAKDGEFWWDELERLLLAPGTLPPTLDLAIAGTMHHWDVGSAAVYQEEDRRRDRGRRAWQGALGSRHALYYAVWSVLLPLPFAERRDVIDAIASWAGDRGAARASHRVVREDELVELARGGLVDVGSHTVTHAMFPAQAAALQARELADSKTALETILGAPVTTFAYPHGERAPESPGLVRDAGFACGCTVVAEPVWKGSERYELPRFAVEDWSGEEFARRLARWLER